MLFYIFFEVRDVWPIGNFVDDLALQRQQYFGFAVRFESFVIQIFDLLLVHQHNIHPLLEFVYDLRLQVFIAGVENLARATPGGVHIDDQQFLIFLAEEAKEVLLILYRGC